MDYRYLKAFVEAARLQNFSKAAAELSIAPSAFTRQIQLFEHSVGQECFIRAGRSVRLTAFGHELSRQVADFEHHIQEAKGIVQDSPLRIGCLQSVFENVMAGFLARHASDLGKDILIEVGGPKYIREKLQSGFLDFSVNTLSLNSEGFTSIQLLTEDLVLVSIKKDWLEMPGDAPWIIYTPLEKAWRDLNKKYAGSLPTTIRTNSLNAAIELAALGVGITLLPEGANIRRREFKKSKLPKLAREPIFLSMLSYKKPPPTHKKFRQLLTDYVKTAAK